MTMLPRQPDSDSVEPPRRLRLAGAPRPEATHESWQSTLSSHYTMVPNGLLDGDLGLSIEEHMMLLALLRWVRGRGSGSVTLSRPGGIRIQNLAPAAIQSERRARQSLQALKERGFVSIMPRTGAPSKYTLHLDRIARHLKLPRGADEDAEPTPPVKAKPTANVYAGKCKDCHRWINVGEGIMRDGLRHVDCSQPHPEARQGRNPGGWFAQAAARTKAETEARKDPNWRLPQR